VKVDNKQADKVDNVNNVDQTKAYQAARHRLNYCSFPIWKYYVEVKGLSKSDAKYKLKLWFFSELGIKIKRRCKVVSWAKLNTEQANAAADLCYKLLQENRQLNRFSRGLEYPGPWPNI
jgi:hypothetical protein